MRTLFILFFCETLNVMALLYQKILQQNFSYTYKDIKKIIRAFFILMLLKGIFILVSYFFVDVIFKIRNLVFMDPFKIPLFIFDVNFKKRELFVNVILHDLPAIPWLLELRNLYVDFFISINPSSMAQSRLNMFFVISKLFGNNCLFLHSLK